ncbi:Heme-degrading domain-containing protein [Pararobbsia alpina]|uniref:heme-degrading domain-containing protein n=1 Tax=Pararobbsia alpina TaxID=621374 RepID=UPI0039A6FB1A
MTKPIPETTQTMASDEVAAQEAALTFERFTHLDAIALGDLLKEDAIARSLPIAFDVFIGERTVYSVALPGSSPDNLEWIRRKRNSVRRFGKSSFRINREQAEKGTSLHDSKAVPEEEYAGHGGSVPILVAGLGPVGVVTVSGLPGWQDHATVVAALTRLLATK